MSIKGKEISESRKKLGMNQTEFGEVFGVSRTTVSNWENDVFFMGRSEERILRQMLETAGVADPAGPYMNLADTDPAESPSENVVSVLRELLREREKRLEEKDEFIEYLKRENTELRARLSDAGSGEAV